MALQKEVFLVDETLVGDYFVDLGKRSFLKHVRVVELLDEPSGQAGALLVKVVISQNASAAIRDAEVKANQVGRLAKVQKTEFAIEPLSEGFLADSGAGSEEE